MKAKGCLETVRPNLTRTEADSDDVTRTTRRCGLPSRVAISFQLSTSEVKKQKLYFLLSAVYELLMCLQQSSERVTVMEKKLRTRRREKSRVGEEIDNSSDPLIPLDALI